MEEAQIQQILQEELSATELRELLHRLGEEEFGGSEHSRIRDIVETTGRDVSDIARILADIRREDWEEKFGAVLDDHAERIERLEDESDAPVPVAERPLSDRAKRFNWRFSGKTYDDPYLQEARDRIQQEHEQRPLAIAIGGVVLVLVMVYNGVQCMQQQPNVPRVEAPSRTYWIEDNGTRRPATEDEAAAMDAARIIAERNRERNGR